MFSDYFNKTIITKTLERIFYLTVTKSNRLLLAVQLESTYPILDGVIGI
jgi:hypothetical protein